jgi:two-component system, LytTR family, response regulator
MGEKIRAFIVDDERHAREDLRRELSNFPDVEIIGEANSVKRAAKLIPQLEPSLVFLDIQMPGEIGFNLLDLVDANFEVVFVTAFDHYAIRAFEVNALDYLLKPVCPDRLAMTIARLSGQEDKRKQQKKQLNYDDYVFIKSQGRIGFLKVDSIVCITANGDYTEFYISDGVKKIMHKPLRQWEEELPPKYFFRINRGAIINANYLDKVEPKGKSIYQIYLRNLPEPLTTSYSRARELRERFL